MQLPLLFAIICYAIFFATFLYLIVFVGDFRFASRRSTSGRKRRPLVAVAIDLALIALFGLQHSLMARQGFKAGGRGSCPQPAERSVYVLAASAALMILFMFWRPIDAMVWNFSEPAGPRPVLGGVLDSAGGPFSSAPS